MSRILRSVLTFALATALGWGGLGCGQQSTSPTSPKGGSEDMKANYMKGGMMPGKDKMEEMMKKAGQKAGAEEPTKKDAGEKAGTDKPKVKPAGEEKK